MPNELMGEKKKNHDYLYRKLVEYLRYHEMDRDSVFLKNVFLHDLDGANWILNTAIENHNSSCIYRLIATGFFKIRPTNKNDQSTAIHRAVYCDFLEIVDRLFYYCDTEINYTDANGLSHFHVACITGNEVVVRNFLTNGVDVNLYYDDSSSLHWALKYKKTSIVELLLNHGADPNAVDKFGLSPLHLATFDLDIMQLLVLFGANVNAKDRLGCTPIFHVFRDDRSKNDRKKLADLLLENGAEVNILSEYRYTVLHLACRGLSTSPCKSSEDSDANIELIELFLKHGADVDARDARNETPLQIAVSALSLEAVKIILDYGGDADCIMFDDERSFSDHAHDFPCFEVVDNLMNILDLLETKGWKFNNHLKDTLVIMKFLVGHNVDCKYTEMENTSIACRLNNLLNFGSEHSVKRSLDNFSLNGQGIGFEEQSARKLGIRLISNHIWILQLAGFYLSSELESYLRSKISSLKRGVLGFLNPDGYNDPYDLDDLNHEIQVMKSMMLNERTSLYDVMSVSSNKAYKSVKSEKFSTILRSFEFRRDFKICGLIIKGHFAKCLARRWFVKSAVRCLVKLGLPDLCGEEICGYLGNEYLLNLCLAAETL